MTIIEEQMKYLTFLKEVVKRDIKKKYYKSVLGVLWTVLNPLLNMLVMTLVFSTLFKRSIENYPIYLLCGQIIFNFMSGTSRQALNTILSNAGYIRSIYIPKYIFVLSRVVEGFVDLLFSLIALFLVMLLTRVPFTLNLLMLPTLLVLVFIFTFGFSLVLATYGTFFRDLQYLFGIFTRLWMWVSALFYPISIVPSTYRFLLDLNPAIHYIGIMRAICYEGVMPSEKSLIIATCYAVLMLLLGVSVFKANENKFFLYV